jgi:GH24 family phage-related lysozyme (muramidase)
MMESTKLTQAKHNATALDEYLAAFNEGLPTSQVGFLGVLLNQANRFVRWLASDPVQSQDSVMQLSLQPYFAPSNRYGQLAIGTRARINQRGIEIIKRFEGFPADVDPDVREAEQAVCQLVHVPLTSNQFSALVSFTYNVGEATLKKSALLKYLNAGRYRAAAKEFDLWVYIGSTRFSKLVARRVAERGLFLSPETR